MILTMTSLNYLLDFYQELLYFNFSFDSPHSTSFSVLNFSYTKLLDINAVSINLVDVYLYPFIYVFLLITGLSIIFCLSYNKDELLSFMFYCQIILFSGYFLFFTDSLITFFFFFMKCF